MPIAVINYLVALSYASNSHTVIALLSDLVYRLPGLVSPLDNHNIRTLKETMLTIRLAHSETFYISVK